MQEAYRLLKPGGRLILTDFFNRRGLEGKDKQLMDKMAYGWAVSSFTTVENFEQAAIETNFKEITIEDASPAVIRSAKRLYRASLPGIIYTKLYCLFKNPSRLIRYNARTAYIQYPALKKGLWKYHVFQGVKG